MDTIKTPKGIELAPNAEVYEGLATFAVVDGGKGLKLTAIDGVSISESDETEEDGEVEKEPTGAREDIANYVRNSNTSMQ